MLNALITTINISLNREVQAMGLGDGSNFFDEFDSKLFILQKNM
jgi:hypothetical protein